MYAGAIWAFSLLQIINRAYYALHDTMTPLVMSVVNIVLNLVVEMPLLWWLGEAGMAVGTLVSFAMQAVVMLWMLDRRVQGLGLRAMVTARAEDAAGDGADGLNAFVCKEVAALPGGVGSAGVDGTVGDADRARRGGLPRRLQSAGRDDDGPAFAAASPQQPGSPPHCRQRVSVVRSCPCALERGVPASDFGELSSSLSLRAEGSRAAAMSERDKAQRTRYRGETPLYLLLLQYSKIIKNAQRRQVRTVPIHDPTGHPNCTFGGEFNSPSTP